MKHRLTRFRRMGITAIAAATALTGLSVLGLSTAASANLASGSSVTAATAPGIANTGTNQGAGNLTATIQAGSSWTTPAGPCLAANAACNNTNSDGFTITVTDSASGATVLFDHAPTITQTIGSGDSSLCNAVTSCAVNAGANGTGTFPNGSIYIALTGPGQASMPTASSLLLSNIGYTTAAAANGPVIVTAVTNGVNAAGHLNSTASAPFTTGFAAANANIGKPTVALIADSTPVITTGGTSTAGPWELQLSGPGTGLAVGDVFYVTIARNDGTNCETAGFPDSVGFATAPIPVVDVAQNGTTTAPPTVSVALAQAGNSSCNGFSTVQNELKVTVTAAATLGTGHYTNGSAIDIILANTGLIASADSYKSANYTTPLVNPTGTNLGNIDVLAGLNTPPTFGSSSRRAGTAATPPDAGGTVVPTNTPAAVANDALIGGSILPSAGSAPGPVATGGAATGACTTSTGAAGFNTIPLAAALTWAIPAGTGVEVGAPVGSPNTTTELTNLTATAAIGATSLSVVCFVTVAAVNGAGQPVAGPSNANIQVAVVTVTSNTPATTLQYNFANCTTALCGESVNNPISPITINENTPGAMGGGVNGYFCITLTQVGVGVVEWNGSSTPTASASGGGGGFAVSPTVTLFTPGGQSGPTVLEGQVTTPSSGTAGKVTISGLSVNVPEVGLNLTGSLVYQSNSPACTSGANLVSSSNPFTLADIAGRTFGEADSDTAAQEFENLGCSTGHDAVGGTTPQVAVVATTDTTFNDAESGSFLAGALPGPGPITPAPGAVSNANHPGGTGILVTPTNVLAAGFMSALKVDGVTDVYVLGGSLAFGQANVTALQSTPVYNCDSSVHVNPINGTTQFLTVHWIFGPDADGTAQQAGDFFGPGGVGTAQFQGAYGTTAYNDTTGMSSSPASSAPDTPVATCIVANDANFQDAGSGGALASNGTAQKGGGALPLFETPATGLSTEAQTGLTNDACRQVINLGGPLAISDAVLNSEIGLGLSVIRIGGIDYTDTSQLIGQFELASVNLSTNPVGFDWDPLYVIVARGDFYTDAFTAAGISNYNRNPNTGGGFIPILLTFNSNATNGGTNYLGNFLQSIGQTGYDLLGGDFAVVNGVTGPATINNLWIIGGTFAVTQSLENTLVGDLNTKGSPS